MFSKSFIKILLLAFAIFHSSFAFSELPLDSDSIKQRIILIGDAGDPSNEFGEPVLIALQREASNFADSTIVVFLGDNIYPNGLPDEDDPNRKEYERRIDEQMNSVIESGSRGIFIPGNHDWKQGNSDSWEQIRRQADYVTNKNYSQISFAPMDGCSGPVVIDYGQYIRFIVLDSQWWLQDDDERPEPEDSLCDFSTEDQIVFALDSVLNVSTDKFVIIAAHHPLNTNGPHGGCFSWKDHIFPLREIDENLWIPLPLIGSVYPLARNLGVSNQDLSNSEYQNMRDKIEDVISKYKEVILYFPAGMKVLLR
jgi:hypothetical protein